MRITRTLARLGLLYCAAAVPSVSSAVSCNLDIGQILIGGYSALAGDLSQQQSVRVRCVVDSLPVPLGGSVSVGLQLLTSAGGSPAWRALPGPLGSTLNYNLFLGPSWQTPWAEGVNNTLSVNVSGLTLINASSVGESFVQLRVPGGQWGARPGLYFDRLTVMLSF